jgi:hypothetical protein
VKYTVEVRDDREEPVVIAQVDAPAPAHALVWVSQGRPLVEWFKVPEGGDLMSDPFIDPPEDDEDEPS